MTPPPGKLREGAGAVPSSRAGLKLVDPQATMLRVACGVLFIARLLVPAESAEAGETLWIVCGWLALAAVAAWLAAREGRFSIQFGWPDAAVGALILGHVVSALAVLAGDGNARSAVNMLWEWIGVGAAFVLMRNVFHDADGRGRLCSLLLTCGVILAALGIWQRFVWYPQIASDYLEWEQLSASGEDPVRLQQLQEELGPELMSVGEGSRLSLRQRILESNEPFARFALANTLGGLLAALLVLAAVVVADRWRLATWGARVLLVGLLFLIGFALLLTKSRTAWTGGACGAAAVAVVLMLRGRDDAAVRRVLTALAIMAALIVAAGAAALPLGLIDRQVFTEAPKSLRYRSEYWGGAWQVIREHPVLGVGPGNFRSHYLRYKQPGASEEISDPHNALLDAWSGGGLIAAGGLLWLVWLGGLRMIRMVRHAMPLDARDGFGTSATTSRVASWTWVTGALACGSVYLATLLLYARRDPQALVLALVWPAAAWHVAAAVRTDRRDAAVQLGGLAAAAALAVHLCGAGGLAMPAVLLTALTLAFCLVRGDGSTNTSEGFRHWRRKWRLRTPRAGYGTAVVSTVLLAGCLWSGFGPSIVAGFELRAGSAELQSRGSSRRAIAQLTRAVKADPLDPVPWRELAMAHFAAWQVGSTEAAAHFQQAIDALHESIERDRFDPYAWRLLGEAWLLRFERTRDPADARNAAEALDQAVQQYPNSSTIRATLARALAAAGDPDRAAAEASQALQLDDLNLAAGHVDKYLPSSDRQELERLSGHGG